MNGHETGDAPSPGLFNLADKTAVVTGGAGIIGAQVCRGLVAHGADIAVADVDGAGSGDLGDEIAREHGVRALGVRCDVSSPGSVAEMVETVRRTFGGIDILHNNAATKTGDPDQFFARFEDFSPDVWREVMTVNLDGMFLVAQAVGRLMVERGRGGSIIQTASIYGITGPDFRIYEGSEYQGRPITTPAVYSAAKAAVVGLTRHLATYWAPHRIRVNTLVPGGVASGQNERFTEYYGNRTPLGRMARPDDMVGAVVYLASDASSYMTGQMMVVDGGWTAW